MTYEEEKNNGTNSMEQTVFKVIRHVIKGEQEHLAC
jgi:hypothetical protein